MLDKKKIKEKLEEEKNMLLNQVHDIGVLNPETNEWEAIPERITSKETDQNEMADRFEDFEERSSLIKILASRLNKVLNTLKEIDKDSFGICEVCGKNIKMVRMEADPSAKTCKEHISKQKN